MGELLERTSIRNESYRLELVATGLAFAETIMHCREQNGVLRAVVFLLQEIKIEEFELRLLIWQEISKFRNPLQLDRFFLHVVHELKHYEHWLADPAAYAKLGKLACEEFVFKSLQKSNHWSLFTSGERIHALEYSNYMRKLYGN